MFQVMVITEGRVQNHGQYDKKSTAVLAGKRRLAKYSNCRVLVIDSDSQTTSLFEKINGKWGDNADYTARHNAKLKEKKLVRTKVLIPDGMQGAIREVARKMREDSTAFD